METTEKTVITVETILNVPIEKAWKTWTEPQHITKWCQASDDWHAPYAENDPRTGGKFRTTMAAKDGTVSFEFEGVYTNVVNHKVMEYEMSDGRKVSVHFYPDRNKTKVVESFDAETLHPVEMQRSGWQAILDNYKKYTESIE